MQYVGGKYDANENKTHCTSFVIGGEEIKVGDYVAMKRLSGYAKIIDVSFTINLSFSECI